MVIAPPLINQDNGVNSLAEDEHLTRLAKLVEKALRSVIEPLGAKTTMVEDIEIDPYGPRIVIQLAPGPGIESVFIDASPDGVEAVYTMRVDKGLDKRVVEEEVSATIESSEEFQGVDEYDVAYDAEEGEITITLRARMIAELPSIDEVRRKVNEVITKLA